MGFVRRRRAPSLFWVRCVPFYKSRVFFHQLGCQSFLGFPIEKPSKERNHLVDNRKQYSQFTSPFFGSGIAIRMSWADFCVGWVVSSRYSSRACIVHLNILSSPQVEQPRESIKEARLSIYAIEIERTVISSMQRGHSGRIDTLLIVSSS